MVSLSQILYYWNEYTFEIIIILCLLFFVTYGIYNKLRGSQGTWSKYYYHLDPKIEDKPVIRRQRDSKGELECRRVLNHIFNKPFNKCRPNFLNNPVTGGSFNMELDCYDDNLRLGVEYDGIQHAKYTRFFHKNKEAFYNQQYRDELKKRMCKDHGVTLINIPHTVKNEDIEYYLIKELKKHGYLKN